MAIGFMYHNHNLHHHDAYHNSPSFHQQHTSFTTHTTPNVFLTGCHNTLLGKTLLIKLKQKGYAVHTVIESTSTSSKHADSLYNLGCDSVTILGNKNHDDSIETETETVTEADILYFTPCLRYLKACTIVIHIGIAYSKNVDDRFMMSFIKVCETVDNIRKFVFISSCNVLITRDIHPIVSTDLHSTTQLVRESQTSQSPPLGVSATNLFRAEQKIIALNLMRSRANQSFVILRPALLWGGQYDQFTFNLVKAANNDTLRLIRKGHFQTSTCHILNACNATIAIIRNMERPTHSHLNNLIYFATDGVQQKQQQQQQQYNHFVKDILHAAHVHPVLIHRAMNRRLPLWMARAMAKFVNWMSSILLPSSSSAIHYSDAAVCRVGLEVCVSDEQTRRDFNYQNAVSVEEGIRMLSTSVSKSQ